MAGKFSLRKFSDINLADHFFDSLKADYPGTDSSPSFITWFNKKAGEGRTALIFDDEEGLGAFISLKAEIEEIKLQGGNLPIKQRTKISTLRIAERYRGQRLGEVDPNRRDDPGPGGRAVDLRRRHLGAVQAGEGGRCGDRARAPDPRRAEGRQARAALRQPGRRGALLQSARRAGRPLRKQHLPHSARAHRQGLQVRRQRAADRQALPLQRR